MANVAPPAGGDELLDPGRPQRRLRGPPQQPQHAAAGPRSHHAPGRESGLRVESREEREGQREGERETLQSVQQEEAVKEEEEEEENWKVVFSF